MNVFYIGGDYMNGLKTIEEILSEPMYGANDMYGDDMSSDDMWPDSVHHQSWHDSWRNSHN